MSERAWKLIREARESGATLLDLSFLQLTSLPEEIVQLSQIHTLDLSSNQLTDVSWLQKLTQIHTLDLSSNQLTDVSWLQKLTQIHTLDLSSNQLTDVSWLKKLTKIQSLDLSGNEQIKDFSFLQKLTHIKALYLRDNKQIKDFSFLEKLNKIDTLDLSGNIQINDFSFLQKLTHIKALYLRNNKQIKDFSFLEKFTEIQALDLSGNIQIKDFSFLEKLTHIKALYLRRNQLTNVSFLEKLTQIQVLYLRNNQLTDVSFLEKLTQIRSLDLRNNQLTNVSFLEKLTQIKTLHLNSNQLTDISVLEKLTQIQTLDLRNNEIKDIRPCIPMIREGLEVIWKDNFRFGILNLFGNPLTSPTPEIVQQGNEAILNYFKELGDDEVTVHEARLLILGEAGAGKTTLARKLCNPDAPMPDEMSETTKGIDIYPHPIKGNEETEDFLMNIWDFGGQEVYHATHQFFLSSRSLYVLLADGRKEEPLDYWLQVQELLGGGSPLLIVMNKKGSIRTPVALKELSGIYPNLRKEELVLNLKDDRDQLSRLTQTVSFHIRNLDHLKRGEKLPKVWVEVRKNLEEIQEPYIHLKEFRKICKEAGIDTPERQNFLSDFLHDLGIILRFREVDILDRMVILQPEWATSAVYKVLDHTKRQEVAGHFHRKDLDQVWDSEEYEDVFIELLALMQRFELCYEIPTKKGQYIVPQLLPEDKPDYPWNTENNLTLYYQYDFLPKGILTRMIVRLHTLIANQDQVWKRGVVLKYQDALAEVTENYRDKRISIKVHGPQARDLMTIIVRELDEINGTFHFNERMSVNKLIPCNCSTCKGLAKPNYYEYEDLIRRKSRGKRTVECKESYDDVDVLSLLTDVLVMNLLTTQTEKDIRQKLAEGKLDEVMEELSLDDDTTAMLKARYANLERDLHEGTIDAATYRSERNKLSRDLLSR